MNQVLSVMGAGLLAAVAQTAFCDGAALTETPVGPGVYTVETSTDRTYEAFAVPDGAVLTVRKGVFYPKDGPKGVDELVWKNVRLTDIERFTARMRVNGTRWVVPEVFHVETITDGGVQCQFQYDGQQIYCFIMEFRQNGADVLARIAAAKRAYRSEEQPYGGDMRKFGVDIPLSDDVFDTTEHLRIIADLGYVLRQGATVVPAPSEIQFVNADTSDLSVKTLYERYLLDRDVLIARNVFLADLASVSGEMSFRDINGGAWTEVPGYCRTNLDDYVQFNLLYKSGARRMGANVQFRQVGPDVYGRVSWAGHSYDSRSLDVPIGPLGNIGVALGVTNKANTGKFAYRNIRAVFNAKKVIVGYYEPCLLKDRVRLWPGVTLPEVSPTNALMGGEATGKKWVTCSAYSPTTNSSGEVTYLYQWQRRSNELECIQVRFADDEESVYGKVVGDRWGYGKVGESVQTGDYQREIMGAVDAVSEKHATNSQGVDVKFQSQALRGLLAARTGRNQHVVTVDEHFNVGSSPLVLRDIKLNLAPTVGQSLSFASLISGQGMLGVCGRVFLGVDLPIGVGLDVDAGAVVLASDRKIPYGIHVARGAALEFEFADGCRPKIETPHLTFALGAKVVLSGAVLDVADEGETLKLVMGCDLTDNDITDVSLELSTALERTHRFGSLFVDADGDLAVTATPKKGLLFIVK